MSTAFITHPDCVLHDMGGDHPESPQRLNAIQDALIAQHLMELLQCHDAPLVEWEQLYRVHDRAYVEDISRRCPDAGRVVLAEDVVGNPHTLTAARRAAGAAVLAVDLVMQARVNNAFCAVRPPGHHAERDKAMGFCLFNNVAVGAAHAFAKYGVKKLAIVDFDVHHGNGTEDIFRSETRVLFCSSFQHPFYPFTVPESNQRPNIIHTPVTAGTQGPEYREAILTQWLPPLRKFGPELILISAGFDAHTGDPLADVQLKESDYRWVTEQIKQIAEECAQGRIVSCLEGGYGLKALAASVVAHLRVLMGVNGA